MKTTLEATLKLAEANKLTDLNTIAEKTSALLTAPYDKLEYSSQYFENIRLYLTDIELNICKGRNGEYQCQTTFGDILSVSEQYHGRSRYLYLQQIALGIIEAKNVLQVRMFCMLSLSSYMQYFNNSDLAMMNDMIKNYLDVTSDISIGELLGKIKSIIMRPWRVDKDIEEYRDKILGCGKILDLLLVKSLKGKYANVY